MEVLVMSSVECNPDFWRGRRVWLSGHTGFKGSWLSLLLIHWGAVVEGYALDPEFIGGFSLYKGIDISGDLSSDIRDDISNVDHLTARILDFEPEFVFHLAAQPLVQRSYVDPIKTWETNVIGTCYLLEALRNLTKPCVAVIITTDKVYENREWDYGYRENDPLGGHDPYSSSKAAVELAISSWRSSYCGSLPRQNPHLRLASARAGNVIGGGDWCENRIVPDSIRALINSEPIPVRSPSSTRPWQHVLEPLSGYLLLAEKVHFDPLLSSAFNFGPNLDSNRSVRELVEEILKNWTGTWIDHSNQDAMHEAVRLDLTTDKSFHQLGWRSRWPFEKTISKTVDWYRRFVAGESPRYLCIEQIDSYFND